MCELGYCPYEDSDGIWCDICANSSEWDVVYGDDYDKFDDFDDFDTL